MSAYRLAQGGLIDRTRSFGFTFDGRPYRGFAGDTLASALVASEVRLFGRSFKYHRPRGVLTAGAEEPNALVELRAGSFREPNTRATVIEIFDGLTARSQNRWPSLAFDLGSINSLLAPLLVAGFYYKTFMWPPWAWERLFEPAIRRAAGLGHASAQPDPDRYEAAQAFCDVLVIGGGAAGLSAARCAGRAGARVVICDEDFMLGGRLNSERCKVDGQSGSGWRMQVEAELATLPRVRVLRRTTVFGAYDDATYAAVERVTDHKLSAAPHEPRQRLWSIVAKRVILATGAIERPIIFGGNDRPGVVMASAARTYLNRYGVAAGRQVALFTTTDDGWTTAFDLADAGVTVPVIVDPRSCIQPPLVAGARRRSIRAMRGCQVTGTRGWHSLRRITVLDQRGRSHGIRVDALAVSGGWNPNIALSTHRGGRPRWSDSLCAFVPDVLPSEMSVVGAANGEFTLGGALREGHAAGARAAEATGFSADDEAPATTDAEAAGVGAFCIVSPTKGRKAFVDFQHDVTRDDLELAAREGYRSVELLKRYTTLGMGTDQGKTSGVNGLAILASVTGRRVPDLGVTAFRPPYSPVAIAALVGRHRGRAYQPVRLTAAHGWAESRRAEFVEVGQWLRARWYSVPGETSSETIVREARVVRERVGICDLSTLGKIEIQGPDAATFLERVCINRFDTLPVGRMRYGLMLREDGFAFDDGVTARLASHRYLMTSTTANAGKVMQHLEYARQVLWPELDVQVCSVTEQWAQYAIAGPQARCLLETVLGDVAELSNESFPYLACTELVLDRFPLRLFRVSFSGELGYEFAVPARYGSSVLEALISAGRDWSAIPYGIEAMNVLRIEKGYIAGPELNGMTTIGDLGLKRMMSDNKDFIGRVMAKRPGLIDPERPSLVGIQSVNSRAPLQAGAHLLPWDARPSAKYDQGYVTSTAFSPTLSRWIGLGFLVNGKHRYGERIRAYNPVRNGDVEVKVVPPVFFDPVGSRLRS